MRSVSAIVTTAALALFAGPARADISGMPDFDQRRDGLIEGDYGGDGSSSCLPTSIMDVFYFLEKNGFNLIKGQQDENDYQEVSDNILALSIFMGTQSAGTFFDPLGSYPSTIANYLDVQALLASAPIDPMMVVYVGADDDPNNEVTFSNMKAWFDLPSPIVMGMGYYDNPDPAFTGKLVHDGGHFVALVGLKSNGTEKTIKYRDPWTDESDDPSSSTYPSSDFFHQSAYVKELPVFEKEYHNYDGLKAKLLRGQYDPAHPLRSRPAVGGLLIVRPFFMLSDWTNALDAAAASSGDATSAAGRRAFRVILPGNDRLGGRVETDIPLTSGPVREVALNPQEPRALFLERGSSDVREVDIGTGESRVFATLEAPRRLAFGGRFRTVPYAVDGRTLLTLGRNGRPDRAVETPAPVNAIAFDAKRGVMVAASLAAGALFEYDDDLALVGVQPLPFVPGEGRLDLCIDPRSGQTWMHRDGSNAVVLRFYDLRGRPHSREVTLFTAGAPVGLHVDRGLIFTSEAGVLREYDLEGAPSRTSPFAGMASDGRFAIARNFFGHEAPGRIVVDSAWGEAGPGGAAGE